jgi:hypothetical protein
MKIHLAWMRVTAAAALVGVSVQQSAAQYAPFKPIPPDPVAPAATYPTAGYPTAAYPAAAYPATAYQPAAPAQAYQPAPAAPAYVANRVPAAYPQTQLQAPAARYQAPATAYQAPAAPAQYAQPPVAYPQTASRYPAAYPYVAQAQPTEAIPAPQGPGPGNGNATPAAEAMPATGMPVEQGMSGAPVASGYPAAAGCGCGASGYTAAGCAATYPDVSQYFGDNCCNQNQWFGGVYWLDMERSGPHPRVLTVEVPDATARPYYPQPPVTFISTANVEPDFRSGIEVRLGSTFSVGGCDSCGCGSGYGYGGCGCNSCQSCNMTNYAWEVAWWGLDRDVNDYTRVDDLPATSHMYGMMNFSGVEFNKGNLGTWRPVNDYYNYDMPIDAAHSPPYAANAEVVLSQRVYTNFSCQNIELNIMRFPCCESSCGCNSGCGSGGGAYDTCGCNSGCASCQAPSSCFSMYGSCGVRYFRTDDDFSYDTEAATFDGTNYDKTMPTGVFDLCYDINIDNNLIGPQLGWTTDYCVCCRWNFFMNSTMGIFGNHIDQTQRLWSPGGGDVRFQQSQGSVDIHNHRDDIAFLGELRAGCSYDINCHWRAVAAYRAVAMTGVATALSQIPDNFSNSDEVGHINTDNSLVIHGIQTGVECRY